jgi:hypothetical protein
MQRREFLKCAAAPFLPRYAQRGVIFRIYSRQIAGDDPERSFWRRTCPETHAWYEGVAAESLPCSAVLAFPPGSPILAEPIRWSDWRILEWSGGRLRRFSDLSERWVSSPSDLIGPQRSIGSAESLAIFKAEAF